MGTLTQAQLISTALTLAGNTGLTTSAQSWLKLIVNDLYSRMAWPFIPGIDTPNASPVSLAAGAYTLSLGAGGAAFTGFRVTDVKRIRMAEAGADISRAWDVPIRSPISVEPGIVPPGNSTKTGRPGVAIVSTPTTSGVVQVAFSPKADRAYSVWLTIEGDFTDSVYTGANVLAYPNDRTVVQGLYAFALQHQQDERGMAAEEKFEKLVTKDLIKYGGKLERNRKWHLSRTRFRGATKPDPTDWMGD